MQVRDFLFFWHIATYQRGWKANFGGVFELLKSQPAPTNNLAKTDLTAKQQRLLEDLRFRTEARRVYRTTPFITILDPDYPPRLLEIAQPPLVLFYQGRRELLQTLSLGVVGSRQATAYSQQALTAIGEELTPLTLISGLAAGADSMAHTYALKRGWGTIAVIGNGFDHVYPRQHAALQQQVAQAGLLLSEYPPEATPMPYRFVARNRLIAGLSHGVLVTEAAVESGSLITANYALQANREVFAVPNRLDAPLGGGTNALIQAGAKLVTRGEDINQELRYYP